MRDGLLAGDYKDFKLLLLQLEIPLPAILCAARRAREHGLQVILNPAPARDLPGVLIALQNPGFQGFVRDRYPYYKNLKTHLIINIFGNSPTEYIELARRFDEVPGIFGLEMNISCPNVDKGGMVFGGDPLLAHTLVRKVRKSTKLTLLVKLSPNVTDIASIAKRVEDEGADAVSLVNIFRAMGVNIYSRKPELGNVIGGLSGPAIKPIAVRMVWETYQRVRIPIIGMGGIMKAEDAIEFMLVGASAVQIGTANLINPQTGREVLMG